MYRYIYFPVFSSSFFVCVCVLGWRRGGGGGVEWFYLCRAADDNQTLKSQLLAFPHRNNF